MQPLVTLLHSTFAAAQTVSLRQAASAQTVADQSEAPPEPTPVQYEVPLGETGTGTVPETSPQQALVRLYAFERQHAAAQEAHLRRAGIDDAQIDIRIRTGVDTTGTPIPVSAAKPK